ncbi:MAG: DUF1697 domain-containing protein [Vicinamibacterales bacterium]
MTTHIGLLRAVNLAGRNTVAMSDLRQLLGRLGMRDAQTLLQSGNVVFRSETASTATLERLLAQAAAEHLGIETDVFVRTAKDWKAVIANNPFPEEAARDPGHLLVMCLKEAPEPAAVAALQRSIKGREVVRAKGAHAYLVYPDGIGRSKLTTAVIERALGTRGTGRNWNTMLKLGVLAERAGRGGQRQGGSE